MTFAQAAAFGIVIAMVVLFVWDRVRYELVALLALGAGLVTGVVPPEAAFSGFGSDIVIIVAAALVVSAAVSRSGIVETAMRPLAPRLRTTGAQVGVLASLVAVMSAFTKNIGALTLLMPAAVQIARRSGRPVSRLLMPLSFGSLLGGLMTLIGTSPNIVVSQLRQDLVGSPFGMFDFMPVGLGLTVAGIAFLSVGWRLLPANRAAGGMQAVVDDYRAEVRLPPQAPFVGRTVRELEDEAEGDVTVAAIIREKVRRYVPSGHWVLFADDILVLECDTRALERIVNAAGLELTPAEDADSVADVRRGRVGTVEAVVTQGSPLIGATAESLRLRDRYRVTLLALSRRGRPLGQRLRRARFEAGDLIVLSGSSEAISEALSALGCQPVATHDLLLHQGRRDLLPAAILAVAMAAVAAGLAPVPVAFFLAAVAVVLLGQLSAAEAYAAIDWPLLILLGALLPVSEALRTTGASEILADGLAVAASYIPPVAAVAMIMVTGMLVTPFLNNAATVLMMAPVAVGLAARLDLDPDPFLMAVAVGAACDFLTPIGHQCNTLVMGPGGYRFGDYWRLGLPLSVIVIVAGTALIVAVWPVAPG